MSLHRNTDNLFKDQLKDHEITPPTGVWNRIEHSLDNKNKKRILPILIFAAASIAIVIGIITLNNLSSNSNNINTDKHLISEFHNTSSESNTISVKLSSDNKDLNKNNVNVKTNNHLTKKDNKNSSASQVKEKNIAKKEKYNFLQPILNQPSNLAVNTPSSKNIHIPSKFVNNYLHKNNNQTTIQRFIEEKKDNNIAITALVAPEYAYRTTNSSTLNKSDQYSESGINSIAGGLNITIKTPKRWSFVTGVFITNAGQNIAANVTTQTSYLSSVDKSNPVIAQSKTVVAENTLGELEFNDLSYSNNNLIVRSPSLDKVSTETVKTDIDIQQQLQFLEIPFSAKFNIIENKSIISLSAGLCTNFLIDNNASFSTDGHSTNGKTNGLKDISYSSKFGIGIEYPVLKRVSINIEPVFRYFISSVSKSKEIEYHPYNFGLNAGLSYKFQ